MKKVFILFFCICCLNFIQAQTWYAGVRAEYGPLMYTQKANTNLDGINEQLKSNLNAKDVYNIELNFFKQLNENFSIHSGLGYSSKKEISANLINLSVDSYKRTYSYTSIPVGVQYTFLKTKKTKPFVSFSMETSYLLKSVETIRFSGENREQTFTNNTDLNSFILGTRICLGFEKSIDEQTKFSFSIAQRSNVNSISNSLIEKRWHSLQAGIGLIHKLGDK